MPMYVYEAKDPERGCAKCSKSFEIMQSINDPKLTKCPDCGAEIFRDGADADKVGTSYVHEKDVAVKAGATMRFRMAPGGGFVVRFAK